MQSIVFSVVVAVLIVVSHCAAMAQRAPSQAEITAYEGLHRAAHEGDIMSIERLVSEGADVNVRDRAGRTPAHVAAFASNDEALKALADAGADMNALQGQAYDVVTIVAVVRRCRLDRQKETAAKASLFVRRLPDVDCTVICWERSLSGGTSRQKI